MGNPEEQVLVAAFAPEHLSGVLRLCEAEGWPSFPADPSRALRAFTAPGVRTVVALHGRDIVGFAHVLSDGEVQAYLSLLVVDAAWRRRGVGHALVVECFRRAGAQRLDVLSDEGASGFYESYRHRQLPGYRLFPPGPEESPN